MNPKRIPVDSSVFRIASRLQAGEIRFSFIVVGADCWKNNVFQRWGLRESPCHDRPRRLPIFFPCRYWLSHQKEHQKLSQNPQFGVYRTFHSVDQIARHFSTEPVCVKKATFFICLLCRFSDRQKSTSLPFPGHRSIEEIARYKIGYLRVSSHRN